MTVNETRGVEPALESLRRAAEQGDGAAKAVLAERLLTCPPYGLEEGTAWGTPALKVGGRMFACIASHKSAEPDTLAVRIPFDRRDEMIATCPETYYLKDHYVDYPCVLVRLKRIREDALKDLLLAGWRFVSSSGRVQQRKKSALERMPARNDRHASKQRLVRR